MQLFNMINVTLQIKCNETINNAKGGKNGK